MVNVTPASSRAADSDDLPFFLFCGCTCIVCGSCFCSVRHRLSWEINDEHDQHLNQSAIFETLFDLLWSCDIQNGMHVESSWHKSTHISTDLASSHPTEGWFQYLSALAFNMFVNVINSHSEHNFPEKLTIVTMCCFSLSFNTIQEVISCSPKSR